MAPTTTSRTSATCASGSRRGFTLVEMLVVIGIIVVLVGLAAPMITRAWRAGDRAATFADLQAIATALEAYKQDHGDYPRIVEAQAFGGTTTSGPTGFLGARMLCRALIGPGPGFSSNVRMIPDGAGVTPNPNQPETLPGPGFRIRPQGRIFGPYLPPAKFKMAPTPGSAGTEPGYFALMDRYAKPILYYPATGKPNIRMGVASYVGDRAQTDPATSLYNWRDNRGDATANQPMNIAAMRRMLGDENANGTIDGPESAAYEGPFILWSGGPDETFGPAAGMPVGTPQEVRRAVQKSDDITNFRQ